VEAKCHAAKFYVEVDDSGDTLNKKIRNGQLAQFNFIFGTASPSTGGTASLESC